MYPDNIFIRVSHIDKTKKLGESGVSYHIFRDVIVNSLKVPVNVFRKMLPVEGFWSLKDMSFDVEQSEIDGIIRQKGAMESELVKVFYQIVMPAAGIFLRHRMERLHPEKPEIDLP
jgi:ABC-type polysaccharide/polyol phosphate transport system ATPase subunit